MWRKESQVLHHGWATRQSAEPIAPRQWLSFNAQRAKPLHRPTKPRRASCTPSSKVCPMSFHLERHFCLILNWNFTWNDIFLHIFLVNDSIRLFAIVKTTKLCCTTFLIFFCCLPRNYTKECSLISWQRKISSVPCLRTFLTTLRAEPNVNIGA